jgi:UPF0716 protein FxsA
MFSRLLALFVIVPAFELYLLIQIGEVIGFSRTLLLILITGMLGSYMARNQGLKVWNSFQTALASGQLPGTQILDGVIILVSGAFLITPGVITDFVGLLGLLPLTRSLIRKFVLARIKVSQIHASASFSTGATHVRTGHTAPNRTTATDSSADTNISVGGTAHYRPGKKERPT